MWTEVRDKIAVTPLRWWLLAVFATVLLAQIVSLRAALRARKRWRVLLRAAANGDWDQVRQAMPPRCRLQLILGGACLLIPGGAVLSTALARRTVTAMLLGGQPAYDSIHAATIHNSLDGQLGSLLLASLFTVPSVLFAALPWGMMVGLRQQARGLRAAVPAVEPTTEAPVSPRPWRSAVLAGAGVALGFLPLVGGVVSYVTRRITGARATAGVDPSAQLAALDSILSHARRGMETGWLIQTSGAVVAAILVTLALARRRSPEGLPWKRTLLWSSACLAGAAACMVVTRPLQAENDMPWPSFHKNPCRCSCGAYIGCPPLSEAEGPDSLERGPVLAISKDGMRTDGRETATMVELTEELATARNNHALLHPGEPFAGQIVVKCEPTVSAARLEEALLAAGRAGYHHVYFVLTTVETIQRPLFGRISRLKSTAARANFEDAGAGTAVPMRGGADLTCVEVVRKVVKLRRAGHEVRLSGPREVGPSP